MLTDNDMMFNFLGTKGVPLVWVIEKDCIYDMPLSQEHSLIFLNAEDCIDISEEYPDHDGITVRFIKNGETLEELQTTEYFGSILLSNPTVLNLRDYPYGRYVESPNAIFDGEKFIITDRDITGFMP
jgi:hypothetical protein